MSRLQLALNVSDLDTAIAFYSKLFGVEPAKRRPGYANFAIPEPPLKLVLMENPGVTHRLNHLGIEMESPAEIRQANDRLQQVDLAVSLETQGTCCYALQDKFWVQDPDGEGWEIYAVLKDSSTFGDNETVVDSVCCA
jgi:catechol-2,3-dioxygenase